MTTPPPPTDATDRAEGPDDGSATRAASDARGPEGARSEPSPAEAAGDNTAEAEAGADDPADAAEDPADGGSGGGDGTGDAGDAGDAGGDPTEPRGRGARPVPEAGGKLAGRAAELLAAVRAVESGERAAAEFYTRPAPEARRPARPAVPPAAAVGGDPADPAGRPRVEVPPGLADLFAEGGAPPSLALPAAMALGGEAAEALRADPWRLLTVPGVRPEQADGFARALLGAECDPQDPRRGPALAQWTLLRAALSGHTVLDHDGLVRRLAGLGVADAEAALESAVAEGQLVDFHEPAPEAGTAAPADASDDVSEEEPPPGVRLYGLERWAVAEESLAEGLYRLVSTFAAERPDGDAPPPGGDEAWEGAARATRSPSAAELVRRVAGHALVTHTGGEASRAEIAELLAAATSVGLRAWAVTATDDARDRFAALLPEPTEAPSDDTPAGAGVATLAGLLAGAEGPGRDAEGALALDLLAVTDAALLDTEAGAAVAESLADGSRLVLSGDPLGLGPVGPGRVLGDVLAAGVCPHVSSRTPDPGPLGELVSGVGAGELLQVEAPDRELVIVPVRDAGEAVHRAVQLVTDSVPRAVGVPASETRVVTVGHGGGAGTTALNAALKARLNPGPGAFGGFDPEDRVVYTPGPGRALHARVVGADAEGLRLECAGRPLVVPRELVATTVRHGWAVTAHQAVGRRWPAVVVVLPGDAGEALDRPWVYTAFGRGLRHVSVVHGVGSELPRAVAERPGAERHTRLRSLLSAQSAAQSAAEAG
ncbi:DNA helicase RecD [Streptomyces durbertensis]|uniref:DNA helicase RecD n=1 Tax=Streptomyces durbertensis TaxID=2448886 RepID=A0ABR6EAH4_9ACTN|nr:helix-hairpin-helix domain-containing protein [Streptomyces durbertensis]MBB1242143.1 DNA helicase RecD [Streptomyces durbertensis]